MKPKHHIGIIATLVLIGGSGWFAVTYMQMQNAEKKVDTRQTAGKERLYSLAEVARHSSPDDCWTTIRGKVYDITSYIPRHPGGDEIERACGTDATSLFETRTLKDGKPIGSGQPHSENARQRLESLYIGELQ